MSEKKTKGEHKLKLMTEEAGLQETANEMAKSIAKMYEDRDRKAVGAKEHLASQLAVTVEKYCTANGVMSALDAVRTVFGDKSEHTIYTEIQMAQRLAKSLSVIAGKMGMKVGELDPEDMHSLCDGFYKADVTNDKLGPEELAKQLMILQLCQNVGPSAQDVSDFCRTADEEIEKAREDLKTFCAENDIDFNELVDEKKDGEE